MTESSAPAPSFFAALAALLRSPQRLVFLWNWKNAVLSLVLRGPIFLVATVHRGWKSALAALFTESIFCVLTAGFYGAIVQTLRNAEPEWLTVIFLTVIMPGLFQGLEYWLHWLRGTPHLRVAEFTSVAVSAIAALFNWYAMRRGALLVGTEGRAFGADLRRLPGLALALLGVLPRKSVRRLKSRPSDVLQRTGGGECL